MSDQPDLTAFGSGRIVKSSARRPIDLEHHPIRTRGYLREFFEAVLRMRTGDQRLERQAGAAQLAALYGPMPVVAAVICLTDFNRGLQPDDARFPQMSTSGSDLHGSYSEEPFGDPKRRPWWLVLPHRPWRDPKIEAKLPPDPPAPPADAAAGEADKVLWAELLKVSQDIWKNEETRFRNLNTRAVAVVSAASVITTLIAFFAKDLFEPAKRPLRGTALVAAQILTVAAIAGFVAAILTVVVGVLLPGGRDVFGNNAIAGLVYRHTYTSGIWRDRVLYVTKSATVRTSLEVDIAAAREYAGIYEGLAHRNRGKAFALGWGYLLLGLGLTCAAVVAVMVVLIGNTPA